MKILIVEDEFNAREGLAALIQKTSPQHEICGKAADGEEGYDMATSLKPDLIFADIELPKLNGLQMIKKIVSLKQKTLFVILSGYAEFEYAQQAIKYGVSEYLLKPITYNKLIDVIKNMENLQNLKKLNVGEPLPQNEILRSVLLNERTTSQNALNIIKNTVVPENMYIINIYYGKNVDVSGLIKIVISFCKFYSFENYYFSSLMEDKFITLFINSKCMFDDLIKRINYNLIYSLQNYKYKDFTITLLPIEDIDQIPKILNEIKYLNSWALTLGNNKVIYAQLIPIIKNEENIKVEQFDMRALSAIKKGDIDELSIVNEKFLNYLRASKFFPNQIRNICTNYVFSILVCYKEFKVDVYEKMQDFMLFDKLKNCCTMAEIKDCLDSLTNMYGADSLPQKKVNSILVKKTLNYISSFYGDRVSLEEIALKMNVSSEYLSHLFTKELGTSFSDYLKRYRIDIAKKLMSASNLRIYEIGEKVGYKDPKYFSKIFKEVTGFTPKEYMMK